MTWTLMGLGNPESKYIGTRHNVGRDFLSALRDDLPKEAKVIIPEVYMNESGKALKPVIKSPAAAKRLIVLHDDLDLPLGTVRVVFGRGSAGHKGVESVVRAVRTKDFVRIRIGISAPKKGGKVAKPDVLGKFKPSEAAALKKTKKSVKDALLLLLGEGLAPAMNEINAR